MLVSGIESTNTMDRDERGRFTKKSGTNSKKLTLRIKEDKYQKLKQIAQEQGITAHEVARNILQEFLENHESSINEES